MNEMFAFVVLLEHMILAAAAIISIALGEKALSATVKGSWLVGATAMAYWAGSIL